LGEESEETRKGWTSPVTRKLVANCMRRELRKLENKTWSYHGGEQHLHRRRGGFKSKRNLPQKKNKIGRENGKGTGRRVKGQIIRYTWVIRLQRKRQD